MQYCLKLSEMTEPEKSPKYSGFSKVARYLVFKVTVFP